MYTFVYSCVFPIVPIGCLVFALIMEDEDSAGVVEHK